MTDRDRLIEFIKYAHGICRDENCEVCQLKKEYGTCRMIAIADHLLANGIIVPPCKVGDVIYHLYPIQGIVAKKVKRIQYGSYGLMIADSNGAFHSDMIGKTVFLTKEDAEAKLRECRNGNM